MANGDTAALAGFEPVPGSKDVRLGYDDINRLADWVAARTAGRRVGASGSVLVTPTGSNDSYDVTVTVNFPSGRFTAPPRVVATPQTSAATRQHCGIKSVTAESFELYYFRASGVATGIQWIALEAG